jgi:phosphonatase-like hydrolase
MAIKLVVFDMAGTTVEDNSNVHDALIKGFAANSFTIDRSDANSVMGIPKPVAIRSLLTGKFGLTEGVGSLTSKIHETFLAEMIHFYKTDPGVKGKPNAEETFAQLRGKGIKVCLDTGFSRDIADTIIERLGWKDKIDFSITSDEVNNGRPFPDMILKAMDITTITDAAEVAKVGDTASDMQEGTSAGCKYVIGITTGAFTHDDLAKEKHTHLITDLLEVVSIVS